MHTHTCVLIEISMEIGMLNFWLGLLVTALMKETYFTYLPCPTLKRPIFGAILDPPPLLTLIWDVINERSLIDSNCVLGFGSGNWQGGFPVSTCHST